LRTILSPALLVFDAAILPDFVFHKDMEVDEQAIPLFLASQGKLEAFTIRYFSN